MQCKKVSGNDFSLEDLMMSVREVGSVSNENKAKRARRSGSAISNSRSSQTRCYVNTGPLPAWLGVSGLSSYSSNILTRRRSCLSFPYPRFDIAGLFYSS